MALENATTENKKTFKTIDLIASDTTSLWPTQGDTDWFWSQQGRFWSRDGTKSLKKDTGRKPLNVQDHDAECPSKKHLCETDPLGWRTKYTTQRDSTVDQEMPMDPK